MKQRLVADGSVPLSFAMRARIVTTVRIVAHCFEALFIVGPLALVLLEQKKPRAAGRVVPPLLGVSILLSGFALAFSVESFYRHYPSLGSITTRHPSDVAFLVSTALVVAIMFTPLVMNRARRKAGMGPLPPTVFALFIGAALIVGTTVRSLLLTLAR